MEKSIENIWKQGFLSSDALVAPKLNNLYNQKSIHLIDKFKRMFKINLYAIIIGSLLFLGVSYIFGFPLMGLGFFLTLSVIVIVNKRLSSRLYKFEMSESSYQYIKAFDNWMKLMVNTNSTMARFYYPLFFLSGVVGFWFYRFNGEQLGELITNKLMLSFPETPLIFSMPLVIILFVSFIIAILSYFGAKIYYWDLKIVYGGVLAKLDEITADMEELRS